MKKNTTQKLSNRLVKYGALSVAIVGITDATGQIIYTDINPDVGGDGVNYNLDLNDDGINDFKFQQRDFGPNTGLIFVPFTYGGANSNAVLASSNYTYIYPFILNPGDVISNANSNWNSNSLIMELNYNNCERGLWCDGVFDRYVGLRFNVLNGTGTEDDETFYGWARLDVTDDTFWLIKDYAYESTEGATISAGDDGTLGIEDNLFSNVRIVALNKSIGLYNLTEKVNYNLFSITGQSVLKGTTEINTHVIEANTVANGVYILELKGANSVIRKKVTL